MRKLIKILGGYTEILITALVVFVEMFGGVHLSDFFNEHSYLKYEKKNRKEE